MTKLSYAVYQHVNGTVSFVYVLPEFMSSVAGLRQILVFWDYRGTCLSLTLNPKTFVYLEIPEIRTT